MSFELLVPRRAVVGLANIFFEIAIFRAQIDSKEYKSLLFRNTEQWGRSKSSSSSFYQFHCESNKRLTIIFPTRLTHIFSKSSTLKMYAIIPTILALATTALAAPSGLEPRACTYETAQYASICQQGNNLFCTGDVNICPSGKTDTFDAKATSANEAACAGLTMSASCKITVACC